MPDLKPFFNELVRFEVEIWDAVDTRLRAEHDLSLSRFEPMRIIASTPDCRVHDIARALSLTTGGTSKLVDQIEVAGHCRRRPNPNDRRSSIIELTATGKRLVQKATRTVEDELDKRIGSVLPDRSLQQLTATLAKLRESGRAGSELAA
ncbi:MAG TPA: MarR family winged helix-turn-helix transcriptional regulator [Solirubrobacteraceae bacterium]|nr:MarR family winged helix-turn-helix transcriptional regulator [Solirubrobacteraceae bacterium]